MESVNTKSIWSFDFQWRWRRHTHICIYVYMGTHRLISCDWQFCLRSLCTRACFCLSIRLMTTSKCVCSFISVCVCAPRLFFWRLSRNAHFPCDIKFVWKKWSGKLLVRKGPHQSLRYNARVTHTWASLDQYFQNHHIWLWLFFYLLR